MYTRAMIIIAEISELAIGGDHEVIGTKELKDNYVKVEPSIICHDGESIQVRINSRICIYW